MKVLKRTIVTIMFIMVSFHAFSLENYIVLSNDVYTKKTASEDSNVVRKISFPEIITVSEIKGSGLIINGILDKWACIAKDGSEWINYQYIMNFPFVVSSDKYYTFESGNTISILNYHYENNILYFDVEKMLNSYYHKDIKYKIVAGPVIQNINLIDNKWAKLYKFCEELRGRVGNLKNVKKDYSNIEIEHPGVILDYGIQVGMDFEKIEEIFGDSYETDDDVYTYDAWNIGYGYKLYFYVSDNKVVKIRHYFDK